MKVALVYSFKDSDWFSCRVILRNLLKAYEQHFGEENILRINYSNVDGVIQSDVQKLIDQKITRVVMLDHQPSPILFFKNLKSLDGHELSNEREYVFHIYGDFPLFLVDWYQTSEIIKGKKVKFVCASEKQKNYISKFFQGDDNIFTCPFPVDAEEFKFDSAKREIIRKQYNVLNDDKLFIYVGRLSYQKRIIDMIEQFIVAIKNEYISKGSKLMLVGPFDKLKLLYLGDFGIEGEYFRLMDKLVCEYPEYKENIIFTGKLDHSDLCDYYNASDCFYSLSTYHDEDYGMAVAESICTGLPTILTDWAGYSSFRVEKNLETSHYAKVELGEILPTINFKEVQEAFNSFSKKKFDREKNSKLALEKFGVQAIREKVKNIHEAEVQEFKGATQTLIYIKNQATMRRHELFKFETEKKYNHFYYEVYDAYTK